MIKKKVRKSSSSKRASVTHKIHKRISHNIKNSSQSKNLKNIKKNNLISNSNTDTKIQVNTINANNLLLSKPTSSESNIEQSNNTINTEQAISPIEKQVPVFKDNNILTDNDSKLLKTVGIILGTIIILFWVLIVVMSIHISTGPKIVERNVTVLYYESLISPFENLLKISDKSYIGSMSLLGYLTEEKITIGNATSGTVKYVVDGKQNKISLTLNAHEYDNLFVVNKTSSIVYNVTGIYSYKNDKFVFDVVSITELNGVSLNGKKFLREVREQRIENMTEGEEKPGVSFNIERGIVGVFCLLG